MAHPEMDADTCWGCGADFDDSVTYSKCFLKNEHTNDEEVAVCVACFEELEGYKTL